MEVDMDVNKFLREYFFAAKKKDDEVDVEEKEVPEEVVPDTIEVKPVEDNLNLDKLPQIEYTNQNKTVMDILQVLRDYFKNIGLEILYQDGNMLIPFLDKVLVIGIANIQEKEANLKVKMSVYKFEPWRLIKEIEI